MQRFQLENFECMQHCNYVWIRANFVYESKSCDDFESINLILVAIMPVWECIDTQVMVLNVFGWFTSKPVIDIMASNCQSWIGGFRIR